MKSFKQYTTESLDKPYILRTGYEGRWTKSWKFTTDDGRTGTVVFDSLDASPFVTTEVSFSVDRDHHVTGGGDAFRIFATVAQAIERFVKDHKQLERIDYEAAKGGPGESENSRIKLYHRLTKKLAAKVKFKLTNFKDTSRATIFSLVK